MATSQSIERHKANILKQIEAVLGQNTMELPIGFRMFYGAPEAEKNPQTYPQFFGPRLSALKYVEQSKDAVLHEYAVYQPVNLLNFIPSREHAEQIDRLFQLMSQLIQLMPELSPEKQKEHLDGLQVLGLFTKILFGLDTHYSRPQIERIAHEMAISIRNKIAIALREGRKVYRGDLVTYEDINAGRFVPDLIRMIENPRSMCSRGRISYIVYDKTYFNLLTYAVEVCHLDHLIHGVYFIRDSTEKDPCCAKANDIFRARGKSINTCVPSEYILLRPHNLVNWVRSV